MNISVSFGSDNSTEPTAKKKNPIHKKPWFWLLIILIASVAVRITSRTQPKNLFIGNEDEDISSAFKFEPKTDNFTVKENSDEIEDNNYEENYYEDEVPAQTDENTNSTQKLATQNENGKSMFHFILNITTKKYHTKECSAVKKLTEEKRLDTDIEADSLKEAKEIIESQGYGLCGICDK